MEKNLLLNRVNGKGQLMRLSISLILTVAMLLALFNFLGCEKSGDHDSDEGGRNGVNSSAKEELWKFKKGVAVPNKNIFVWPTFSSILGQLAGEESAYMVTKLSEDEFLALVEELGLERCDDLFEFWPDVFYDADIHEVVNGWDVTKAPNEYTYYGENPDKQIKMAARYENEKAFLRTSAKARIFLDEKGNMTGETEVLDRE